MHDEIIRSRRNPGVLRLKALHKAEGRREHGAFLVEGVRGVEAALAAKAPLLEAWISPRLTRHPRGERLAAALAAAKPTLTESTDEVLQAASSARTHQGVLAACRLTEPPPAPTDYPPGDLVVLADLQDPGNVGTIWRTAAAVGVGLLVQGTAGVDPYGPKVIRSAAGAAFQLPVLRRSLDEEYLSDLRAVGYQLVGAAGGGTARYDVTTWGSRIALLVGQEGPGLPDSWLDLCDETVRIPMAAGVESLNVSVSASLLMYERARCNEFATLGSGGLPG